MKTEIPPFGVHISIAGGIHHAPKRAAKLGCDVFQIFCRNQRIWKSSPLSRDDIRKFKEGCEKHGIHAASVHGSYLINPGSPERRKLTKSRKLFQEELNRTHALSIPYYAIHPGSHKGSGTTACLKRIAQTLDWVLERTYSQRTTILLETTAGQGTSVGNRFEHLRDILSFTEYPDRIGVCFDTCHAFAAGYDLRSPASTRRVFSEFNTIIGIRKLLLFHLNDSKRELGSRIDRHTHIGKGEIGNEGFAALLADQRFHRHPMILETPGKDAQDRRNLATLRRLCR